MSLSRSKLLMVVGTFDSLGGKRSSIGAKISNLLCDFLPTIVNGGSYSDLDIDFRAYDVIIWMPHIDNSERKIILDIKRVNPTVLLISSKRIDGRSYSDFELVGRLLKNRSGLGIVIDASTNPYSFKLIDPLGNIYVDTSSIPDFVVVLSRRVTEILSYTRLPSIRRGARIEDVTVEDAFIDKIKVFGNRFTELVNAVNPERFLGNASTRCMAGFPSARKGRWVLVSRRNVNKETITCEDFVQIPLDSLRVVYYRGAYKPSIDTPIHLELYRHFLNINYIVHGHVYLKDAPTTSHNIPCGCVEEFKDVCEVFKDVTIKSGILNLKGHGCLIMVNKLEQLDNIELISRPLLEKN